VIAENKAGAGGATGIRRGSTRAGRWLHDPDEPVVDLDPAGRPTRSSAANRSSRSTSSSRSRASPPDPTVLVVRADAPWKTFAEFVADLKTKPGRYNYGSSGNYGTMHVPMEMLKSSAGISVTHIPTPAPAPRCWRCWAARSMRCPPGRPACWRTSRPASCARWRTGRQAADVDARGAELEAIGPSRCSSRKWSALFVPAGTPEAIVQNCEPQPEGRRRSTGRGDDQPRRQPDRVPRRARVPELLGADAKLMTEAVRKIGKVE